MLSCPTALPLSRQTLASTAGSQRRANAAAGSATGGAIGSCGRGRPDRPAASPGGTFPGHHHRSGAGLPPIRDWVEQHYQFAGYIAGYDPPDAAGRAAIRTELGYQPDEKVCLVTVGGSGVGADLLRRAVAAYPAAKQLVPGLRMIMVAGPRIDPATLPSHDGLEVHGYVHDLYQHLAVCDLAVVQGGLTTTMELTAAQRPFMYVPLRHHFEQNFHVRHRLNRYRAGRCLDYGDTAPDLLAQAIAGEVGRPSATSRWRPTEPRGPPPILPSSSNQARRGSRLAQDVGQAVVPGQRHAAVQRRPRLRQLAEAAERLAVHDQGRRERSHPRHPFCCAQQRGKHRAGSFWLVRRQPGARNRQVHLIPQHPGVPGRQPDASQQPVGLGEAAGDRVASASGARQRSK
jgi:hypothetical protein